MKNYLILIICLLTSVLSFSQNDTQKRRDILKDIRIFVNDDGTEFIAFHPELTDYIIQELSELDWGKISATELKKQNSYLRKQNKLLTEQHRDYKTLTDSLSKQHTYFTKIIMKKDGEIDIKVLKIEELEKQIENYKKLEANLEKQKKNLKRKNFWLSVGNIVTGTISIITLTILALQK